MPQEIGQIYKTLIPSLSDDASIEEAFQMYHYGTATYNGNNLQPQSIEKHIIDLNEDISRIDGTISSLANVYIEEISTTVRPNVIVSQEPPIVPLTIRGVINQTAPLQKWQSNTGSPNDVAVISNAGFAAFAGYLSLGSPVIPTTTGLSISLSGDHKGVTVRGSNGQTENMQEWQNNIGTALAFVAADGDITAPTINSTDLNVLGNAQIHTLTLIDDLNSEEIFANKITLSGAIGLVVQQDSSLEGDVDILGSTTTKNLTVDGLLETTGNVTSTGDITAQGDLGGANLNLSQSMTTTGDITANGIIRAKSPNQGTTGGVRILGDVNGDAYLQFVDSGQTSEFANLRATSSGLNLSTNTSITGTLGVISPVGNNSVGVRQVYISSSDPISSNGQNGDMWVRYI